VAFAASQLSKHLQNPSPEHHAAADQVILYLYATRFLSIEWLQQEFRKGRFQIGYLPTADMPADGLTKALSRQRFEHFRSLLRLADVQEQIQRTE